MCVNHVYLNMHFSTKSLLSCFSVPNESEQPSCYGSRLTDRGYGSFSNGTSFTIGRPEVCVNNSFVPVCESVTHEEAILVCNDAESRYGALTKPIFGSSSDYTMNDEATTVITDLYCPPEYFYDFYLGNCNQTLASSTDGCSSYQPQPVLSCYEGKW